MKGMLPQRKLDTLEINGKVESLRKKKEYIKNQAKILKTGQSNNQNKLTGWVCQQKQNDRVSEHENRFIESIQAEQERKESIQSEQEREERLKNKEVMRVLWTMPEGLAFLLL